MNNLILNLVNLLDHVILHYANLSLELVAAARESLEINFLASYFGWSAYDKEEILNAFGSLFPISNNRIEPAHKSVLDWLSDSVKAGQYFTNVQEGNKSI